jgi:hypothetical protein
MARWPISAWLMIVANVIPLIGVLFFGWNAVLVLALFWIENLLIGGFNVLRMAGSGYVHREKSTIFLIVFFIIHYGAFCLVHGKILIDLLGIEIRPEFMPMIETSGLMNLAVDGWVILRMLFVDFAPAIWVGVGAIFMSKLVSFIEEFLLRGSIFNRRPNQFMMQPYAQIVVLHVGLLLGAVVLRELGSPTWLLAIIVLLKIGADWKQYQRQHVAEKTQHQIKDF